MPVNRVFLGWDQPLVPAAAHWLWESYAQTHPQISAQTAPTHDEEADAGPHWGRCDLSGVLIVVPVARAGRRLLEILASRAKGQLLLPPRIVTVGQLPEQLYATEKPIANPLRALLALVAVLRKLPAEQLEQIGPTAPDPDDFTAWFQLARDLGQWHEDLAANALGFGDAARILTQNSDTFDPDRFELLASIQEQWMAILTECGLIDVHAARQQAIAQNTLATDKSIILLGTVDLPGVHRRMLQALAQSAPGSDDALRGAIITLIQAPQDLADSFDDLGCLVVDRWLERRLDIPPQLIHIVDRPRDQAYQLLEVIGSAEITGQADGQASADTQPTLGGRFSADQITVGVGDAQLAPLLQRTLELAGLPARWAVGRPIEQTRPYLLLEALGRYMESRRFDDFAALLRHPDIEAFLDSDPGEPEPRTHLSRLSLLDKHATEHLQRKLDGRWLGSSAAADQLARIEQRILSLLKVSPAGRLPLGRWSEPIAAALGQVYETNSWDRHDPDDAQMIRSTEVLADVLDQMAQLPDDDPITPQVSFSDAAQLVLSRLNGLAIPHEGGPAAIEMLGWLELQLDDAPALIITGFNEGLIPQSRSGDALLADWARRALGLEDNRRRYARDVMMLQAILAARSDEQAGQVILIAGRRSQDNNPLLPSRLMLSCQPEDLPARVDNFYPGDDDASVPPAPLLLEPGGRNCFLIPEPMRQAGRGITHLNVTAFRDYIADPYRFYLRHVLKKSALDDRIMEMDALSFGSLAHHVLQSFGQSDERDATDPKKIQGLFDRQLDHLIVERFGRDPGPAIIIQQEQLRFRLHKLALWQAEQAQQGWRIICELVEKKYRTSINVDDQPFTLVGKIDRIDLHESHGYRIVDYKTGDSAKAPDKTHRRSGQWVDLQLPLYRTLVQSDELIDTQIDIELGYVHLPKDPADIGFAKADWKEADLISAQEKAMEVIRLIRSGRFWPPGPAATYADGLEGICLDPCIERNKIVHQVGLKLEATDQGTDPV